MEVWVAIYRGRFRGEKETPLMEVLKKKLNLFTKIRVANESRYVPSEWESQME